MITDYMKKSYDDLVKGVFEGQQSFNRQEGFEIFSAAFLLALKNTMDEDAHKLLSIAVLDKLIADDLLTNTH